MTKKVLNTEAIANELEGASLFFSKPVIKKEKTDPGKIDSTPPSDFLERKKDNPPGKEKAEIKETSKLASKQASMQAINQDELIECVRKTVKQIGKETVFLRLTPQEKRELAAVVYSLNEIYSGEIKKTTENQIGRIGLNFLLEDYKDRGDNSILASVLKALNA